MSKWEKAKGYVKALDDILFKDSEASLNYHFLERVRGFMCHLFMTYEVLFPYLKGFHLTLESFLDTRGEDGWVLADDLWNAYLENQLHDGTISGGQMGDLKNRSIYGSPPELIKPVPLFI